MNQKSTCKNLIHGVICLISDISYGGKEVSVSLHRFLHLTLLLETAPQIKSFPCIFHNSVCEREIKIEIDYMEHFSNVSYTYFIAKLRVHNVIQRFTVKVKD